MKNVTLKRLVLENFKGCGNFSMEPAGKNVSVFGDNGTFKTTTFDAFCWLLFGKDSLGQSNFDIKTLESSGEALHRLEHSVEAVFDFDGEELSLRKVYSEKWTKKRGSAGQEFTGHSVDHWVDGVPSKKKEFDAAVSLICDEELFRLLTSPRFFNEGLHWQKRREILLSVCGDVSDQDVFASDPKLADLPAILGKHSLEDFRKIIKARMP